MSSDYILWDVLDEHLDEAGFCFEQWSSALDSSRFNLDEVERGPEARLRAHLDGLLVGGERAREQLLCPLVEDTDADPSLTFVATYLVLEAGGADDWTLILDQLDAAEGERWGALVRGLELSGRQGLEARLLWELEGCSEHGLAGRLHALAAHEPRPDRRVLDWLRSADTQVASAACRLMRRGADPALVEGLRGPLSCDITELQLEALDSACVISPEQIWPWVRSLAGDDRSPVQARACMWVALLGDIGVHDWLIDELGPDPSTLRALGFCGRRRAVEFALELLDDEALGPLAGELIQTITGLPDGDEYWRTRALDDDDEPPSFEDDDLDAELVADPILELPLPRSDAISSWWSHAQEGFDPSARYLAGVPLGPGGVELALTRLSCRQRHPLALELAARSHARGHLDTRAFCDRQRQQLAAMPALEFGPGLH